MQNSDSDSTWDDQVRTYVMKRDYQRALEALVHGYQDAVVRYCVAQLSHEAQGQDIAQDVFVAAYESMMRLQDDFASRVDVRPWLFGIARNKCKQYWRNTQRRSAILGDRRKAIADSVHNTGDREGAERLASREREDRQRTERLLACMEKLTHRERTLISLRYSGEKLTLGTLPN